MTRSPVLSSPMLGRALRFFAASVLLVACSSGSSNQPTDDGGVPPDGGGSPDGGTTPDGGAGGTGGTGGTTPDGLPVISRFGADPRGLPAGGGPATLSWEVIGADTLSIDQGIGTVVGDSTTVTVTDTTRFTLTATNNVGSVTRGTGVIVFSDEPVLSGRVDPESSIEVIEQALMAGALSGTDALRYKVFAVFGDPRLPTEFEVEGRIHGTPVLSELSEKLLDLPQEVQDELRPFLIPPNQPGTWYAGIQSSKRTDAKGSGNSFEELDLVGGKLQLLWESDAPPEDQVWFESTLAAMVEAAYEPLSKLMGSEQQPREPIPCDSGSPYEILVIYDSGSESLGAAKRNPFCAANNATWIEINLPALRAGRSQKRFEKMAAATVAHELMHAIIFTFAPSEGHDAPPICWLHESTATWAEDFVYPIADTEKLYLPDLFSDPTDSLDELFAEHEYATYLFHLYLERQFGTQLIREFWEKTESHKALAAVDEVLNAHADEDHKGLTKAWPKFVVANWNDPPVTFYDTADGLTLGVPDYTMPDPRKEDPIKITAQQKVVEMDEVSLGLDYLSAQYFHFKLTDSSVHNIVLANGFTFDLQEGAPEFFPTDVTLYAAELSQEEREGARVQVLVKANGAWLPDPFDITDVAFVPFCQDYIEERVEELVVIFSNGRWREGDRDPIAPKGLAPRLFVSNYSCGDWVGSASSTAVIDTESRSETTIVDYENLLFTRERLSHEALLEGEGEINFLGQIVPFDVSALSAIRYEPEIVDVSWEIDGLDVSGDNECIIIGEGMMTADDAGLAFFDMRPSLVGPTAELGSAYRSFSMTVVFSAPGLPVTRDCSETGVEMVPFQTGLEGGLRNTDLGLFEVSPDGVSINNSWEIGDTTYQLELLGFPDP